MSCSACNLAEYLKRTGARVYAVTDDACRCDTCKAGPMSGSRIHTCRGVSECGACHAKPLSTPAQRENK